MYQDITKDISKYIYEKISAYDSKSAYEKICKELGRCEKAWRIISTFRPVWPPWLAWPSGLRTHSILLYHCHRCWLFCQKIGRIFKDVRRYIRTHLFHSVVYAVHGSLCHIINNAIKHTCPPLSESPSVRPGIKLLLIFLESSSSSPSLSLSSFLTADHYILILIIMISYHPNIFHKSPLKRFDPGKYRGGEVHQW